MGKADFYKKGDYNVICDRSGFKVKASSTRKEWNGLRVFNRFWEPRHPQDFLKSFPDRQSVPDPRTESKDKFLSTNQVKAGDF